MRKLPRLLFVFVLVFAISCTKEEEINDLDDNLYISGIKTTNGASEIINIDLKTKQENSFGINCYTFSSGVFDSRNKCFGYIDCNTNFTLIDPVAGETIKTIRLPSMLINVVIDNKNNTLIGISNASNKNYILNINLDNGIVISKSHVEIEGEITSCTRFLVSSAEYVIIKDTALITINPQTGKILKSIKLEEFLDNATFNEEQNLLFGLNYSTEKDKYFIVTLNRSTGKISGKAELQVKNFQTCISGYDSKSGSYILMGSDNKILFINPESGEVTNLFSLEFNVNEFKLWRE
jgi:hypothetical protein